MSVGERLRRRLTGHIGRYGQPLTYARGAATATVVARVSVMNTGTKYAWFTSAEVAAWSAPQAPAYVVTLPGDFQPFGSPVQPGSDTVTVAGRVCLVRKLDQPRLGIVVVRTVLFVAG